MLRFGQLRRRQSDRLAQLRRNRRLAGFAEMLGLMRDLLLLVAERIEQLAGVVFRGGESAMPLLRSALQFGGVGAEKRGRRGDNLIAVHGEVERQVMAFDAPAPFA